MFSHFIEISLPVLILVVRLCRVLTGAFHLHFEMCLFMRDLDAPLVY